MVKIESHVNGKVSSNVETMLHELAALRAENKHLRSKLSRNQRGSQIVRTAIVDAHQIVMAAFSDQSTGCQAMQKGHGISRRRWEWAVAFLRYAGILPMINKGWRNGLAFAITDLNEAVRLLEVAATELDLADGYRRLRSALYARRM